MSNGAGNNAKTFPLGQDSAGVITFEHVSVIASTLVVPSPNSNSQLRWKIRHPLALSHLVCISPILCVAEQTFGLWLSDSLLP